MKLRLPRLQFSLRTLVIGMVIVAAIVGWQGSRYARHQERLKANAPLIEAQVAFAAAHVYLDTSPGRNTVLESYEEFAFGELGNPQADLLSFRTDGFDAQGIANTIRAAKSLHLFAEIESVSGYQRIPGPPLPNEFLNELLKLPKLKELKIGNAQIDDRAVNILPTASPLEKLHSTTPQFTAGGVIRLLKKAPQLKQLWLNERALSPEVATLLNQRIVPMANSPEELPMRVYSATTDLNLGQEVETGLQQLTAPYELFLNDRSRNGCANPYGVVIPGAMPKTYAGLRARALFAQVADRMTVTDCDELLRAEIYDTADFHLANCPRLEQLLLKLSHELLLEKLPALTKLEIQHCGKIQIQDCDALQVVEHHGSFFPDMPPTLVLQRLPRLRTLECPGLDLTLVDVPALEHVTLYNATSKTLAAVRALPNLQDLSLRFAENCQEIAADELRALGQLATLKKLSISGLLPVPVEQRLELLQELNQFSNFHFSEN